MDELTEEKEARDWCYTLKDMIQTSTKKLTSNGNMVVEISIWSDEELQTLKEKLKAKL